MRSYSVVFVVACAGALTALLADASITPDTFLCLALGRSLVHDGLPLVEHLTVMGDGKAWVDQQWLAHITLFGVEQGTGFIGLLLLRVIVSVVCTAGALVYAAHSGGSRWALIGGGLLGIALTVFKAKLRAQLFAEPLFVLTLWRLFEHARRPSWRTPLMLAPVLVLWANLHGSVLLGLGLTALSLGLALLERRASAIDAALLLMAAAAVFASPYGLHLATYYRQTLGNPLFRTYLAEWRSPEWHESSFLIVIGAATAGLLAVRYRALSAYERAVIAALLALSFYSVRYALFLGYALMFCLPLLLSSHDHGPAPLGFKGASLLAAAASALAVLFSVRGFDRRSEALWPRQTSQLVAALAGSSGAVFAEMRQADRLVWQSPALAGRIAFDARFELLDAAQAQMISDVLAGRSLEQGLRKYGVFVVSEPSAGPLLARAGFVLQASDAQAQVYAAAKR